MGYAFDAIASGLADVVLTGGSDVLARLTYGGFNSLRSVDPDPCRPFDRERNGLSIGEAAGILVFEEAERARRRGAPILAEFLGYGVTSDAYHMTAPDPSGVAGGRAIRAALASAGIDAEDVDYVNAHGTATPQNDSAETAALKVALGERAREIPVSSIKSMIGHCLCASGAIEAVATVLTIRDRTVPPTIHYENPDPACDLDYVPNEARDADVRVALSNSFAFGGNSTVVVLGARPEPRRCRRRGVITGTGAVCPLGRSAPEFYRRLLAGESAIRPMTAEEREGLQATHVARCDGFTPQPEIPPMKARRFDRGSQFAIVACAQAIAEAGYDVARGSRSRSASRSARAPPAPGR